METMGLGITRTDPDTLVQNDLHSCSRIPHIGELNNGNVRLEERGKSHRH